MWPHGIKTLTISRWIPSQRPVMWNFDIFFVVSLNKLLNQHLRSPWSATPRLFHSEVSKWWRKLWWVLYEITYLFIKFNGIFISWRTFFPAAPNWPSLHAIHMIKAKPMQFQTMLLLYVIFQCFEVINIFVRNYVEIIIQICECKLMTCPLGSACFPFS